MPDLNLDDVVVLVFQEAKDATDEAFADAVVALAEDLGLLEGRDPEVLRRYLLSEAGREWLAERRVGVQVGTLICVEKKGRK